MKQIRALLFYNLFLSFSFPFLLLYFFLQAILKGKSLRGWKERLGYYPREIKNLSCHRPIWVHAASVGEVTAAKPIVSKIKELNPEIKILLSTITPTGNIIAKRTIKEADAVIYLPLDFPLVVLRALKALKPKALVLIETELWPNLLYLAKKFRIKTILVNGRLGRTFKSYPFIKSLYQEIFEHLDFLGMQTQEEAKKGMKMGADKGKVLVVGNSKFDQLVPDLNHSNLEHLRKEFRINSGCPVIVAGSTHKGEEEKVLYAFKEVKDKCPEAVLILAPRHPERTPKVEEILAKSNWRYLRRTKIEGPRTRGDGRPDIIILDTIGELAKIYLLADLVFVGGSLVPIGGHNPVEAAGLGKPVIFGPYIHNFRDSGELLKAGGGAVEVADEAELSQIFLSLLRHPERGREMGEKGREIVEGNRGASEKYARLILRILEP